MAIGQKSVILVQLDSNIGCIEEGLESFVQLFILNLNFGFIGIVPYWATILGMALGTFQILLMFAHMIQTGAGCMKYDLNTPFLTILNILLVRPILCCFNEIKHLVGCQNNHHHQFCNSRDYFVSK